MRRSTAGVSHATIAQPPRTVDSGLLLVGDGTQNWTRVHVDDLARLYVLVLTDAPGGKRYIGASGVNPTVCEVAQAVIGPDGALVSSAGEATSGRLGAGFAEALLIRRDSRKPAVGTDSSCADIAGLPRPRV